MLLHLDFSSDVPIYQQIRNEIVLGIAGGRLAPGEKLPTVRALADEAGVNMMTVSKAYQLLKQEGYILTNRRSGAVVNGAFAPSGRLGSTAQATLKLLASEAKLGGISREDFLGLCGQAYDETEV